MFSFLTRLKIRKAYKMSNSLPFMNSTGLIKKILDKIIEAQTPDRFTQDFQETVLGYGSGSARPFLALLKRIGFLNSDGTPTALYKEFRNDNLRSKAMAQALKTGYAPLYKANEYAHKLSKDKLKNNVIQITGANKDSGTVRAIVATFEALNSYVDPNAVLNENSEIEEFDEKSDNKTVDNVKTIAANDVGPKPSQELPVQGRGMNLSYTINLNLPASKDPEVFNAIFKSLKDNLLN